jgi:hypothetical protein
MTYKDLNVGDMVMYQEDPREEKVQAKVLSIDTEKEVVRFRDWEDFEWDEPFDAIEIVVKKKL